MAFAILSSAFGIEFPNRKALVNVIEVVREKKQNIEMVFGGSSNDLENDNPNEVHTNLNISIKFKATWPPGNLHLNIFIISGLGLGRLLPNFLISVTLSINKSPLIY